MPKQGEKQIPDASRVRMLDASEFIFHNRHIRNGAEYATQCRICAPGLGALPGIVEIEVPRRGVDKSDRVDTEETTPRPYADAIAELFGYGSLSDGP